MKKMKFAVILLAATALFSCSKENATNSDESINGATKVTVKLDVSSQEPSSKANDGRQGATATTLHDGMCYFLDGQSRVVKQFAINKATILSDAGQIFTGVPSSAKKLYIIANREVSKTAYPVPAIATALTELKNTLEQDVSTQNTTPTATGTPTTADKVVMEGTADITGGASNYTAAVTITPIMARLEIVKISLSGITSAILEGIYINNIYTEVNLNFVTKPTPSPTKKMLATDFQATGFTPGMFDYNATGLGGTTLIKTAGTDKTWAYQVIPAINATGEDNLPHIVIKLKDVEAPGQAPLATAFVTVMKYTRTGNPPTVIQFDRAIVYRINDIAIDYANIGPDPEDKNINVTAKVTIKAWLLNTIIPAL